MKKKQISTELCYVLGIVLIALGTAIEVFADFGMSTVVAPAYLLHLFISETIPWFSFGIAEYCVQFLLLLLLVIVVHQFRLSYFFSFVTAILYGICLDFFLSFMPLFPNLLIYRMLAFVIGTFIVTIGVAFIFHTYISPEVYELFVLEICHHFQLKISTIKTSYDVISCVIAILMSYIFFSSLKGIGIGTVISALINGTLIGWFTKKMERNFSFVDTFPFRQYFTK